MSNSSLVDYIRLSPNYSAGRTYNIDRITPHYCGGNCTVETLGEIFAPTTRQASSNYGIGSDGRIGMYVEEHNRPWTSGSAYNDNRAVTIECANLGDGSLTDDCWGSLVALCVDICLRNGIEKLVYTGDDDGNLTMHKWYDNTDCPGPWLSNQFIRLASEVNAILNGDLPDESEDEMVCLIRPDGENYNVFYDGGILHYLGKPQEADAIREVYRQTHGGKEIPYIELGTASDHLGTHFMNAVKRTIP